MVSSINKLKKIIKKLRSPNGCPWDKEQTPNSITPHIIEEAYELVDAIHSNDTNKIKDELSDVLLHVIMLCEMLEEKSNCTFDDIADHCSEKMIRRHPHVFGKKKAKNINDVWEVWEKEKEKERKEDSILNNIPKVFPALLKAEKIHKKVSHIGFDWPNKNMAIEKINEECNELLIAIKNNDEVNMDEEVGDILFTIVNILRVHKKSAEELLQKTNKKFETRFKILEKIVKKEKKEIKNYTIEELNLLWDHAKKLEKISK